MQYARTIVQWTLAAIRTHAHSLRLALGSIFAGAFIASALGSAAVAQDETFLHVPARDRLLASLAGGHPRLLIGTGGFDDLARAANEDELLKEWRDAIVARAGDLIDAAPSEYVIPDGKRLLATSRRVFDRVTTLAVAYQLTDDERLLDRAWAELNAAANFPDWNPSHFLDTAEMTAAFALGYDWLYDAWSDDQRSVLRESIVSKGLEPALASYRGESSYRWWVQSHHNWNQVCNGGIALGALAIADESPDLAAELVHSGLQSLRRAMREFAPDGGWAEGPGYWRYATIYNVLHLAALETALGEDFGYGEYPGFARTGEAPIYLTGATGRTFNFADGGDSPLNAPQMLWLARRFDRDDFANWQRDRARAHALDLVWGAPLSDLNETAAPPLDRHFEGMGVVTMRSSWNDPGALFVGVKAGSNAVNHSNLDLGSFIFEALGERWAIDIGRDDYNMPGYFGDQRWTYYRLRAEGHNTLVLNPGDGPEQDPRAAAPVTDISFEADEAWAEVDLTPAYHGSAPGATARRRITLGNDRAELVVEDWIDPGDDDIDMWWFMHTTAAVELHDSGHAATLRIGGKSARVAIDAPNNVAFTLMDAAPLPTSPNPSMQAANVGVRKLAIRMPVDEPLHLAVRLTPVE